MVAAIVTQELVNAAANRLAAEFGKNPSNRQVFSAIGFGSMTTIAKLMNVWRSTAPIQEVNVSRLPLQLVTVLEQLIRDTEKTVQETCANDIGNARDSEQLLIQENELLQTQLASMQAQIRAFYEERSVAQAQAAHLQAGNASLKHDLDAERSTSGSLRVDLAKASLLINEYLPRTENELKDCRQFLTDAHQAQARAELQAAVAIERADGLERQLGELKR